MYQINVQNNIILWRGVHEASTTSR